MCSLEAWLQLYIQFGPLRGVLKYSVKLGYKKRGHKWGKCVSLLCVRYICLKRYTWKRLWGARKASNLLKGLYIVREIIYIEFKAKHKSFIGAIRTCLIIDVMTAVTPIVIALSLMALLLVIKTVGLLLDSPLNSSLLPFG